MPWKMNLEGGGLYLNCHHKKMFSQIQNQKIECASAVWLMLYIYACTHDDHAVHILIAFWDKMEFNPPIIFIPRSPIHIPHIMYAHHRPPPHHTPHTQYTIHNTHTHTHTCTHAHNYRMHMYVHVQPDLGLWGR